MTEIWRLTKVKAVTGLSTSGVYAEMKAGRFPRQVHLSSMAVGWYSDEIDAWLEAKRQERDANLPRKRGRPRKNPFLSVA